MSMNKFLTYVAAALCAVSGPAMAGPLDEVIKVQVLEGWRTADGQHMAALQIELEEGWKTYWRKPGEAGIPPRFDWRRSDNLDGIDISWPVPKQLPQLGFMTIGYDRSVVVPLIVTPDAPGDEVSLSGKIDLGVCKDICVPISLRVDQNLSADANKRDPRIIAALADQPFSAREGRVSHVSCQFSPIEDGLRLTTEIDLPAGQGQETAVVETSDPKLWVTEARTTRKGGRLTAESDLYHVDGQAFALDRSQVRITVLSASQAVEIHGCSAGS